MAGDCVRTRLWDSLVEQPFGANLEVDKVWATPNSQFGTRIRARQDARKRARAPKWSFGTAHLQVGLSRAAHRRLSDDDIYGEPDLDPCPRRLLARQGLDVGVLGWPWRQPWRLMDRMPPEDQLQEEVALGAQERGGLA